ncbi:putative secreted protein [Corynebacterium kroppenstedtii DSM 44385]|uniref:Putative secreted protein n=1 Tax=Corynebacterium kroppenstedtii (strain DSM 44385 / JCM 11950 / CIP 105744 / CCUG 35717) TaxID=645127 RepID=C4LH99_CORK4|nr:putative secreted protein [Corynebacterium kroppenstedtii DSM 44385]
MRSLLLFSVGVFCGVVLGVCGVWVGCVVFFVVAETAAG